MTTDKTVQTEKVARKRMPKYETVTVIENEEFLKLVSALENKEISVATLAKNIGVSPTTANLWNDAVPMQMFDPSKANKTALTALLQLGGVDIDSFSIDNWECPERKTNANDIDYQIGQFYKLPANNGKQSASCVYSVEYVNSDYVLFVPVSGFARDEAGFELKAPRSQSRISARALKPELFVQA